MNRRTNLLEQAFERALWASRLVMLIAVVGSVLLAFGSFYLAIIDAISVFAIFKDYADPSLGVQDYTKLRNDAVTTIVRVIEFFQLALKLPYEQAQDLLYLAAGILFVSGAVYLTAPRRLEAPGLNEDSIQQDETQRNS